jgi:predicted alpha/beta hydrolase
MASVETVRARPEPIEVTTQDGARFELILLEPVAPPARALIYWLPAMGVPARHYLPLAEALAAQGIAIALHEWRGIGSSSQRAGRRENWGYRELLSQDLPAGMAAFLRRFPGRSCYLGGHSLGGQLACVYAGLHPQEIDGLVLVASGAPYWRRFHRGALIGIAYALAPVVSALLGYLPGRRIGFGGNEARGVIADWSRSGRSGRYAADGMDEDLEQALAQVDTPVLAIRLATDWLAPSASLAWLLGKLPRSDRQAIVMDRERLGVPADHFSWMKSPAAMAAEVGAWLAAGKSSRASAARTP